MGNQGTAGKGPPDAEPGYTVDLHDTTLFVPMRRPHPVGSVLRLRLRGRDGLVLQALAKVESDGRGESSGRPSGVELRLLEVRPATGAEEADSVSLRPPSLVPSQTPGPVRVLVVDDDATLRSQAASLIQSAGHDVLEAENGAEAINLAVKGDVDLILTDVTMPVLDGWQFLRMARARDELKDIPVIFLTSLTSDAERFRGYALGVDDYIDKPYDPQGLVGRVERALARRLKFADEQAALRGDLRRVGLPNLLSLLEIERRTGRLEVRGDGVGGRILLDQGRVMGLEIDHDLAPEEPMDRFYAMLGWKEGEFALFDEPVDRESDIGMSISHVLLQLARLEDEINAPNR